MRPKGRERSDVEREKDALTFVPRPPSLPTPMRLYSGKVAPLASEIVRTLTEGRDIESDRPHDTELDVQAVLNNYLALEREATDRAKELIDNRGLPASEFARMRKLAAEQKGIRVGEDLVDFLLDQLVEMFMHSNNVDEIYSADVELRRKMAPILKRHLAVDDDIEHEVRGKLKHVQEGTRTWEVEYARIRDEIRRRKGV